MGNGRTITKHENRITVLENNEKKQDEKIGEQNKKIDNLIKVVQGLKKKVFKEQN